jgi:serine/threonine protein kinase
MKALQALHLVGFTHNDVKPSNIMIDFAKDGQVKATLIDFGFAKKFVDSNNNHIEQSEIDMFQGNLVYSSYSQMNFENTSRKDDLISIFYLLATMMNGNKFPCTPSGFDPLKDNSDCSTQTKFFTLKDIKNKCNLVMMAQNLTNLSKQVKSQSSL